MHELHGLLNESCLVTILDGVACQLVVYVARAGKVFAGGLFLF